MGECCSNLLVDIVNQVVDDLESLNAKLEKQRVEEEEDEFLKNLSEEQKTEVILTAENVELPSLNDEFTDLPSPTPRSPAPGYESSIESSDSEYDIISDNIGPQDQTPPEIEHVD